MHRSWYRLCALPSFYLTVLVCVGACMLVTAFWVQGKRWLVLKEEKVWMEAEKLGTLEHMDDERQGKGGEEDEEEEESSDEDEEDEGTEDIRYRAMEERRQKASKRSDERKETAVDMGEDVEERKLPAVSPRRVQPRSPHRQSDGYTGSLFSYTPGIRSLRSIVDA